MNKDSTTDKIFEKLPLEIRADFGTSVLKNIFNSCGASADLCDAVFDTFLEDFDDHGGMCSYPWHFSEAEFDEDETCGFCGKERDQHLAKLSCVFDDEPSSGPEEGERFRVRLRQAMAKRRYNFEPSERIPENGAYSVFNELSRLGQDLGISQGIDGEWVWFLRIIATLRARTDLVK